MTTTQDHLTTLRQAANRNLAALASGQVKLQLQAQRAAAAHRQAAEKTFQKLRREAFKAAKLEVAALQEELHQLDDLMEGDAILDLGCGEEGRQGALEEVDHRRDQVLEELGRLRDHWQL